VPWSVLGPQFIRQWGVPRGKLMPEHLEILGQSGSGKSYFEMHVLLDRARLRGATSWWWPPNQPTRRCSDTGWPIIDSWPPSDPRESCHIYWVRAPGVGKAAQDEQARKIYELLAKLWHPDANIIVVIDEIAYLTVDLNSTRDYPLKTVLTKYYREGRALGITMVASTQRPQGVPRQMHSSRAGPCASPRRTKKTPKEWRRFSAESALTCPFCNCLIARIRVPNRAQFDGEKVHQLDRPPLPAPVKRR
jgi:hypothetical protein